MGFLGGGARKPRAFNHQYIYVDTRKEKLDKMEESAKRELGILPEKEFDPNEIRGKFSENTVHLKKHLSKKRRPFFWAIALVLIILLIFLWNYILTGEWSLSLF